MVITSMIAVRIILVCLVFCLTILTAYTVRLWDTKKRGRK